jgi:predicted nucleic-acid-binding protein
VVLWSLLNNQSFRLENETIFATAFPLYCSSKNDFSDAVILQNIVHDEPKYARVS